MENYVQIRARCSLRKLTPALRATLAILKSNIQNQNESSVTSSARVRNEKKHFRLGRENYSEDSTTISCRLPSRRELQLILQSFCSFKRKEEKKGLPLPPLCTILQKLLVHNASNHSENCQHEETEPAMAAATIPIYKPCVGKKTHHYIFILQSWYLKTIKQQ